MPSTACMLWEWAAHDAGKRGSSCWGAAQGCHGSPGRKVCPRHAGPSCALIWLLCPRCHMALPTILAKTCLRPVVSRPGSSDRAVQGRVQHLHLCACISRACMRKCQSCTKLQALQHWQPCTFAMLLHAVCVAKCSGSWGICGTSVFQQPAVALPVDRSSSHLAPAHTPP